MRKSYKVVIADDDPLVCRALTGILQTDGSIDVVGIAGNGQDALNVVRELKPDLVLMDIHMPLINGIEATQEIKSSSEVYVLVLTVDDDEDIILKAIKAGADGFIAKDCDPALLLDGIHKVAEGVPVVYPELSGHLLFKVLRSKPTKPNSDQLSVLTSREIDVLRLIAKGLSNREIADNLTISIQTVKTHVSNILDKLEVRDRTQAALIAMSHKSL